MIQILEFMVAYPVMEFGMHLQYNQSLMNYKLQTFDTSHLLTFLVLTVGAMGTYLSYIPVCRLSEIDTTII